MVYTATHAHIWTRAVVWTELDVWFWKIFSLRGHNKSKSDEHIDPCLHLNQPVLAVFLNHFDALCTSRTSFLTTINALLKTVKAFLITDSHVQKMLK